MRVCFSWHLRNVKRAISMLQMKSDMLVRNAKPMTTEMSAHATPSNAVSHKIHNQMARKSVCGLSVTLSLDSLCCLSQHRSLVATHGYTHTSTNLRITCYYLLLAKTHKTHVSCSFQSGGSGVRYSPHLMLVQPNLGVEEQQPKAGMSLLRFPAPLFRLLHLRTWRLDQLC